VARVEYANGVIMWRRSIAAKVLWALIITAVVAGIVAVPDVELGLRAFFLLLIAAWSWILWERVWRPHLAATPEGLIVRRATDAIFVPWHNIASVSANYPHGPGGACIQVRVRVGQHFGTHVPKRGVLAWFFELTCEADEAIELITQRAQEADPFPELGQRDRATSY
jgi:hypothetical protein